MCSVIPFLRSVISVCTVIPMFCFSYVVYISYALYFLCSVIPVCLQFFHVISVPSLLSNDVDVATLHDVIYCQ